MQILIQQPELPDPSYVHCHTTVMKMFCFPFNHLSTVMLNFLKQNLSVHLLQKTASFESQCNLNPFTLQDQVDLTIVTYMSVHLMHFLTLSKSNQDAEALLEPSGRINREHCTYCSDFDLQLSIKAKTWLLLYVLGTRGKK